MRIAADIGLKGQSDELTMDLDSNNELVRLDLDGNVQADYVIEDQDLTISSSKATYETLAATGVPSILFSNQCKWTYGGLSGSADQVSIDRDGEAFRPSGEASINIDQSNDSGQAAITVDFEKGLISQDAFALSENVTANIGDSLSLTCQDLRGTIDSNGSLSTMKAKTDCVIQLPNSSGGGTVSSEQVDYHAGDSNAPYFRISGSPTWSSNRHEGVADAFTYWPNTRALHGNGSVKFTFDIPSKQAGLVADQVGTIVAVADRCQFNMPAGAFDGNVSISHPDWNLRTDHMDLTTSNQGTFMDQALATGRVEFRNLGNPPSDGKNRKNPVFDASQIKDEEWTLTSHRLQLNKLQSENGPDMEANGNVVLLHGANAIRGEHVRSTSSPDVFEIRQSPVINSPTRFHLKGNPSSAVTFDRTDSTLKTVGPYSFELPIKTINQ